MGKVQREDTLFSPPWILASPLLYASHRRDDLPLEFVGKAVLDRKAPDPVLGEAELNARPGGIVGGGAGYKAS